MVSCRKDSLRSLGLSKHPNLVLIAEVTVAVEVDEYRAAVGIAVAVRIPQELGADGGSIVRRSWYSEGQDQIDIGGDDLKAPYIY